MMQRRDFLSRAAGGAAAFGILRHLGACREAESPSSFRTVRDRYFLQALQLHPVVSTYLGGDGYDPSLSAVNGKLRDYRPEALAEESRLYRYIQSQLGRMDRAR